MRNFQGSIEVRNKYSDHVHNSSGQSFEIPKAEESSNETKPLCTVQRKPLRKGITTYRRGCYKDLAKATYMLKLR